MFQPNAENKIGTTVSRKENKSPSLATMIPCKNCREKSIFYYLEKVYI